MGIFRRARRGRYAAENAAVAPAAAAAVAPAGAAAAAAAAANPAGAAGGGAAAAAAAATAATGSAAGERSVAGKRSNDGASRLAGFLRAGSGPKVSPPEPVLPRPTRFTPDTVAASIAADAERFVATFPYAASPVPEGALDFTRGSLTHIEAMLGALHEAGRMLPERLHQSIAVYLLETARREFGGRYLRFEQSDPLILLVGEPRAEIGLCAMSRVGSRVQNGPDDSIIHFYASISPLIAEGAQVTLR